MRLVDADMLIKTIPTEEINARMAIATAPTIEAEPIKHAHWIHEHLASTNGGSYAVVRCSNCLSQYPITEENYCPNCGAKMDEVEE